MSNQIEDAVISAARAKGFKINSAVCQTIAIDLAGSSLEGDTILIPSKGSLKVADYLRDLHDRAPSGFSRLQQPDKPDDERTVSQMRRRRPPITADDIAKYTGVTRSHLVELAASRSTNR
ncbi:hypothetical protein G8O24_10310 [Bradyrhizobium sp. INPA01-394B]|uniref:Uncharacterized protein n=1 Tax=Bradyrhizobium campsiandrae TaxID=1729892 RepID=A0ABR7U296_9BRAD|nr:hypothetical protein [Bradyrhizobium campsiandrae]MBC9877732.1 hypothetical protein [Bradyrhizobium campsiandrae]MBC9977713.1 hypothetical protein [Bradyrhizobium campsiandrae]